MRRRVAAQETRLTTRSPFNLEATVRVLQRRASNRVDTWRAPSYVRLFSIAQQLALVEVKNRGSLDDPDVRYEIACGTVTAAENIIVRHKLCRILGLDVDPIRLQHLVQIDRSLQSAAIALRGMRPPRFADLFESFASVIPFQQLSLDAGVAIVSRLVERFGEHLDHREHRYYAFPSAQRVAAARLDRLRACGLSASKAVTLRNIARLIDAGELDEEQLESMSTSEALQCLIDLPGIGPWSAGLVLLRGLGRLDVFPPGDVGAARGLRTLLQLEPNASIEGIAERFGADKGYLYFCNLGVSLVSKGLIGRSEGNRG